MKLTIVKYRLVKFGRHLVSGSIGALAGGALLMATAANATDYFNYAVTINDNALTDAGGGDNERVYADTANIASTSSTATRADTNLSDDVVFTPNVLNSTYSSVTHNGVSDDPSIFNIGITSYTPPTNYTLTFQSGANANDIYKGKMTSYGVANSSSIQSVPMGQTYYLDIVNSSGAPYTANLVFQGVNTVSGYTNIDAGNIQLNGSVNFAGDVYAGSMNVNTTSGVYFNSNVDINNGSITFQKAGNVTFNRDLDGFINFAGYDGKVTLNDSQVYDSIDTALSGTGTLIFGGSANIDGSVGATAALKKIQLDSNQVNIIDGATKANTVEINASGVLGFGGGLDTRLADSSLGVVDFNNYNATVQIGNNGSLIGNVTTDTNNNGNLVMVSGTQGITGQVGNEGKALAQLIIGGEQSLGGQLGSGLVTSNDHVSTTTITGDVYATNTYLYNNGTSTSSSLTMANGYNLNSTVETGDADMGVLNLAGGLQTVTGNVGTYGSRLDQVNSGANGATSNFGSSLAVTNVFADAVTNTGSGTTNFSNNVTATNTLNVNAGTTNVAYDTTAATINITTGTGNFTNNVTATTTNIGTGSGNFNTNAGTTNSNIAFSDAGTANLYKGLTGNIDFASKQAVVNVWDGQTIAGSVTSTGGTRGTLNFKGEGTITDDIGTNVNNGITALNINTEGVNKTVTAQGNIYAESVNIKNGGTLTLDANKSIVSTTATALTGAQQAITTDVNNTGTLTLTGGGHTVTGVVGANGTALTSINAGAADTDTFNNMVYATNLTYTGNGIVVLNGQTGIDPNTAGMKGTVDFGTNGAGMLHIGDNVNLTTGSSGIQFANANAATMTFNGSSTVTGVVGGNTAGNSTFKAIYAGANGATVTFKDNVHVMENTSTPATFYVSGTGTVNFEGNLYGDLVYNADGTVNVSHDKSISVETPNLLAVTTTTDGNGTLNFLGKTTLDTDIGTSDKMLKAVTFNSESNNITQTINKNIYANDVIIGRVGGTTAIAKQDAAGTYDYAGATNMSIFTGVTTANVTTDVALGGNLNLASATTALNVGTSHITVGNNVVTNGAAMSFTVNTNDITNNSAVSTLENSGQIIATNGSLTMTGDEKVHINYVGSLKQAGTYTLIDADPLGGTQSDLGDETGTKVSDNSFVIDTSIAQVATGPNVGDLVVTADRTGGATYAADQLYAEKSNTVGHFANNAASVLAGIAASGAQSGDMVQVIQKLEIDSFGYGNTAENLATQVKRLAPVVNNSLSQSAFAASALPTTTIGNRMANLRGDLAMSAADGAGTGLSAGNDTLKNGVWVKLMGGVGDQDARKGYDGYKTNTWGLIVGADKKVSDKALLGVAISGAMTNIDQQDFRAGDKTKMNTYQLSAYGSYDITNRLYIDGSIAVGKVDYDGDRQTAIGRTASANYSGSYESVNLGAGYRINMGDKKVLTPMIAANYTALHNDAYTEKGADALNLSVDKQNLDRTRAGIGLRFTNQLETAGGTIYRPEISAMVSHDFGSVVQNTTASYAGDTSGTTFVTPNNNAERDAITVGAGVTVLTGKSSSVQVRYDVEKRDSYLGQGGAVQARWEF